MKIALLGYGKMGKMAEQAAAAKGHQIIYRMNTSQRDWDKIEQADICIDFSHPDAVIPQLEQCAIRKKNVVIGTTGWMVRLDEAMAIAEAHGIGVIYAPNFSIGVHLFLKILEQSAQLIDRFSEYDAAAIEFHHRQKKDTPSGTGLEICRLLEKNIGRIDRLDISSVRVGSIPGKHQVYFDSPVDTITISHEARSREGFAKGAIQAADWLQGKKGFFTIDDLINGVLS